MGDWSDEDLYADVVPIAFDDGSLAVEPEFIFPEDRDHHDDLRTGEGDAG